MAEGLSQEEQKRLVSHYPDLRFVIKLSEYHGVFASELTWSHEDMEILYYFTVTLARSSLSKIGAVFIMLFIFFLF